MKIKILLLSLFTIALVFSACKKETVNLNLDYGYEYYPIDSGHTLIYRVDSTFYDEFFDTIYTHTWVVTETVLQLDEALDGNPRARIGRTQYWWETLPPTDLVPEIFYVTKSDSELDYQDDNLRFMKMVFPVLNDREWDGNIYLNENDFNLHETYVDWQYKYTNVGQPYTVQGEEYAETLHLSYIENESLISRTFAEERFAKGIGMIYRKVDQLELNTADLTPFIGIEWPQRANQGFYTEWQLIGWE